MPVRMLPISSEELGHSDEKRLDSEFENHLRRLGDDLLPIRSLRGMLKTFEVVDVEDAKSEIEDERQSATPNRAMDIALDMGNELPETGKMPVLPDNPTDDDLLNFAENHPSVKAVLRLFRGKIVDVKKK